jgi:hypothetical protein
VNEQTPQRNGKFDWRVIAGGFLLIFIQGLIWAGVFWSTLSDHSRRLDLIEKRQEDNYLSRTEYERRHEDLRREVEDLKRETEDSRKVLMDLERRVR